MTTLSVLHEIDLRLIACYPMQICTINVFYWLSYTRETLNQVEKRFLRKLSGWITGTINESGWGLLWITHDKCICSSGRWGTEYGGWQKICGNNSKV